MSVQPPSPSGASAPREERHRANGLLLPTHVEDYPVVISPLCLPPHAALNYYVPQVGTACNLCLQYPSRFRSLDDFYLSNVNELDVVPNCTCRSKPPSAPLPHSSSELSFKILDSASTFAYPKLPPALPILQSCAMHSLEGKPLVPGEVPYAFPTANEGDVWPPGPHAGQHATTTALRLLILTEPVLTSDKFYIFFHTIATLRHTEGELNVAYDSMRNHTSCTRPVPGASDAIRHHCSSLVRCIRDYILPMDRVHEMLRAHAPPIWWTCKLFSCKSLAPFGWGIHNALASLHKYLLDLPFMLEHVDRFPLSPKEETTLISFLHLAQFDPNPHLHSPHTRFLMSLSSHILEISSLLMDIAAYGTRRFYLSSHLTFSYCFARNNNLLEQYRLFFADLPPLGTMHKVSTPPSSIEQQRQYFSPLPLLELDKPTKDLFNERLTWSFPDNIPTLHFFTALSRLFPEIVFSLDTWRKAQSEMHSDTCSVHCSSQCTCLRVSVEDQIARKRVSSHLPAGWPVMEFDSEMLHAMPNADTPPVSPARTSTPIPQHPPGQFPDTSSPPPSPIPTPRHTLPEQGHHSLPNSPASV